MRRRLMLRNASGGGGIPYWFQPVEWIAPETGGAYLSTNVHLNSADNLLCVFNYRRASTIANMALLGTKDSNDVKYWFNQYLGQETDIRYGTFRKDGPVYSAVGEHEIKVENGVYYVDGVQLYDMNPQSFQCVAPMAIFAENELSNNGTNYSATNFADSAVRIKTLAVSNKFNGIAGYRKTDGEIGMYDTVSRTFLTNAGTGTFTKGSDI